MKKLLFGSVVFVLLLSTLSACGGPKDEKQAFIDATVEATCLIFQSENIFDPALETQAKEIYTKYGFDANDDAAMEALTTKYEKDQEVQDAISKAIEDCAGDALAGWEDTSGTETTAPVEETTTTEVPVETPAQ